MFERRTVREYRAYMSKLLKAKIFVRWGEWTRKRNETLRCGMRLAKVREAHIKRNTLHQMA